jgi:hypothetical protein
VVTHLGPPSCRRQPSASYARPQGPTAPSPAPHHASWRRASLATVAHGPQGRPERMRIGCAPGDVGQPWCR